MTITITKEMLESATGITVENTVTTVDITRWVGDNSVGRMTLVSQYKEDNQSFVLDGDFGKAHITVSAAISCEYEYDEDKMSLDISKGKGPVPVTSGLPDGMTLENFKQLCAKLGYRF